MDVHSDAYVTEHVEDGNNCTKCDKLWREELVQDNYANNNNNDNDDDDGYDDEEETSLQEM